MAFKAKTCKECGGTYYNPKAHSCPVRMARLQAEFQQKIEEARDARSAAREQALADIEAVIAHYGAGLTA